MGWQREFIEELRRTKFYSHPLAAGYNRCIQKLSVEIYQNDMHFVKEIIQNAEDNNYEKDVRPSLEFFLISDDVAGMCVPATLLVLNNEKGLTRSDVEALCDMSVSTKKGKRDKGYIGCKGIGFKSVFMVSKTPIIISNGFRICFSDEPSEMGLGYIVPEWMDSPTDDAILAACGRSKLPNTVLILPLRHNKVDLVRRQLKGISPENILFLSKIKELHVVDKTKDESGRTDSLKIVRSEPIVSFERQLPLRISSVEVKVTAKMFKVNLRVECDLSEVAGTFPYMVFQGLFPVTHRDTGREREEVSDWAISLAFPEVKRASSHAGDVFSFLPMGLRTGFPFIVNADFLLTSSRDTIKFDEPWNIGILGCIPAAFEAALTRMILPSKSNRNFLADRRDSYKFLPVNSVHADTAYRYSSVGSSENRQVRQRLSPIEPEEASDVRVLKKVRNDILRRVKSQRWIFLSSPGIDNGLQLSKDYDLPANSCLLIKSIFRNILKSSAQCNHPAPSAVLERARSFSDCSGSTFGIVDAYVQERYAPALEALGVSEMTMAQYTSFLSDRGWLSNLPDKIYIRVLSFVAFELKLLDEMYQDEVDLLKIRVTGGRQGLTSFARLDQTELLYTSSIEDADWIYAWIKEFSPWDPVEVLPAKTSQALIEARHSEELITWIRKRATLTELDVQQYAQRLIAKITGGANAKDRNKRDSKLSVLVLQFLYSGVHDKKLSREFVVQCIQSVRQLIVFDDKSSRERNASTQLREAGGVLLPAVVSKWPTLFGFCNSDAKHLIVLTDRYLDPQCSLVENIVNKSGGPDSMLEFVKEAFSAVDLPSISLPAGELVTFRHPVTLVTSLSMLEWLKVFLPGRKAASKWDDRFLRSVKEFAWVKTYHHGWQLPTSVFFSSGFFQDRFTAHDLPFLDVPAYDHLKLTDNANKLVFEELSLVTDVKEGKGCAAVVKYISTCSAKELDLEAVSRFYAYLDEVASLDQVRTVNIWIPAGVTSKVPMWKDPAACIISDELGIFADSRSVTVLDKVYDGSLVPEFFNKLQVPEKASGALHCEIWLEWSCLGSCVSTPMDKVKDEDGCPHNVSYVSRVKVEHVLKDILSNWQDYSEADYEHDFSKDCSRTDTIEGSENDPNSKDPSSKDPKVSNDDSSDGCGSVDSIEASGRADCSNDCGSADSIEASGRADCSEEENEGEEDEDEEEEDEDEDEDEEEKEKEEEEGAVSREDWEKFHSRAWVPVAPEVNELVSEANEAISIVPPSQVLIGDDLELSKSFSEAANGKLHFVWFPPSLSTEELEKLERMYIKMGARKLSELITCEVCFPPDVLKTTVPRGKGLISEGLLRSVLAYLCKNEKKQGLSLEGRHGVLTCLISADEVVVGGQFEKISRLSVETLTAPATIKEGVFVHYDRAERKLYSLRKDHALLKANIRKKKFSSQFVTAVSTGILYDHPELVQGLIDLLTLLWESKFSTKSLEREFKKQKLLIFPEDEKLLMESIARFED